MKELTKLLLHEIARKVTNKTTDDIIFDIVTEMDVSDSERIKLSIPPVEYNDGITRANLWVSTKTLSTFLEKYSTVIHDISIVYNQDTLIGTINIDFWGDHDLSETTQTE